MAKNFYEAGLEFLLTKVTGNVFTDAEIAMLEWLLHAAKSGEVLYFEQLATIIPGSDFDIQIQQVKMKCRLMGLQPVFHQLQRKYEGI